ncbi:hypothetical protein [Kitasatospora sp. NPDC015120]|uniref:hypothetical protein n=1 Tax=Kitasatospora sp. NPDC015120 TaxID=3364023 RepID=UPI0036F48F97
MRAEERGSEPGGDGEDAFEKELVVRLGARAGRLSGGHPPLAELHEAGRRRGRRRRLAAQSAVAAVILLLGLGTTTRLGDGGAGATGPGGTLTPPPGTAGPSFPSGPPSSAPSSWGPDLLGALLTCPEGPESLRLPRWHDIATATPPGWSPSPPRTPPTYSTSPDPSSSTSDGQVNRHVVEVQGEVRDLVATRFPDQYYGTCADLLTGELWVLRVPGGDFDQTVLTTVPHLGVPIHFKDVTASRKRLTELITRIKETDRAYWEAKGVFIRDAWINEDGSGVSVVAPGVSGSEEEEIAQRYGMDIWEVRPN